MSQRATFICNATPIAHLPSHFSTNRLFTNTVGLDDLGQFKVVHRSDCRKTDRALPSGGLCHPKKSKMTLMSDFAGGTPRNHASMTRRQTSTVALSPKSQESSMPYLSRGRQVRRHSLGRASFPGLKFEDVTPAEKTRACKSASLPPATPFPWT